MFSIDTNRTYRVMDEFREEGNHMSRLTQGIEDVAGELRGMSGMEDIIEALYRITDHSLREVRNLLVMANAGTDIVFRYRYTEEQILASCDHRHLDLNLQRVSVRSFSIHHTGNVTVVLPETKREWKTNYGSDPVKREWKMNYNGNAENNADVGVVDMSAMIEILSILG